MNRIEITARLTKDPEITFGKNGRAVAKFSVAENVYDKREKASKAQFFNVIAFGKTAEIIGDTLNKGNKIHIGGNVIVAKEVVDEEGEPYFTAFDDEEIKKLNKLIDTCKGYSMFIKFKVQEPRMMFIPDL